MEPELTIHLYWLGDKSCGSCFARAQYAKETLEAVLPRYGGRVVYEEHVLQPKPNAFSTVVVTQKKPLKLPILKIGHTTLRGEIPSREQLAEIIDRELQS